MSIITIICEELKKQGKSQKELTDFLGVSKNVFTEWKADRNKSYIKYIYQIASFLGTTPEYLKGETNISQTNTVTGNYNVVGNHNSAVHLGSSDGLNQQETELITLFRSLSEINKAKALLYIAELKK